MDEKNIFVIMPFSESPQRDQNGLAKFFQEAFREPIETSDKLKYRYRVRQSDDSFDIRDQIHRDLYDADIVICDLSGLVPNPNVMYELGVRLAISDKPVILCRQKHDENKTVFDVSGLHTKYYDLWDYKGLSEYIIEKIRKFEYGEEDYKSPVHKAIENSPNLLQKIREEHALQKIAACEFGTFSLMRIISQYISMHLKKCGIDNPPTNVSDTDTILRNEHEKLSKLNWTNFYININSQPWLEDYTSDPPIKDIVPSGYLVTINSLVHEYFFTFFASDLLFSMMKDFAIIYWFWSETGIMYNVMSLATKYLADENRNIDYLKQLEDWYKLSNLEVILRESGSV